MCVCVCCVCCKRGECAVFFCPTLIPATGIYNVQHGEDAMLLYTLFTFKEELFMYSKSLTCPRAHIIKF